MTEHVRAILKDREAMTDVALDLAVAAGQIANYCDHVEHNETTVREDVFACAQTLLDTALKMAGSRYDLISLYAERIEQIEMAKVLFRKDRMFVIPIQIAKSWREIQLVQAEHDSYYYQDVVGLARVEQMRHYALHVAKLAGIFARAAKGADQALTAQDLIEQRVPDTLLFAIKIFTALNEKMSDQPFA